jgi:hypothetical protein
MTRTYAALVLALATIAACSDAPGALVAPSVRNVPSHAAQSIGSRYKLRFVSGVNPAGDGEIQSPWFPDAGVTLNTKSPWKNMSASGATITLVNSTHGDWSAPTCATFLNRAYPVSVSSWDIASTSPVLSYAGSWYGTLTVGQTSGTNLGFDGDRLVNGVVTPSEGGIHNVVTNANAAIETRDPTGNNDWFRIELRNAGMQFGSASSPDGSSNPVGAEVACANFTIEARKTSLITP